MGSWATKRRFLYGGGFVLVVALLCVGVFYELFYRTPTCSDDVKNGDESGVDCGGSCKLLCTSEALTPVVYWSKIFHISGDVYTVVAYVENPNINSINKKATYTFRILDNENKLITTKEGQTSIPKNQKFAVFETGIIIKNRTPKITEFAFTSFGPWEKDQGGNIAKAPDITIKNSTLLATTSTPRIEGTITNNSFSVRVPALEIDVFVLDSQENAVATSRTFIDGLAPTASQDFVFTWPQPFALGAEQDVITIIYRPI
jgi:hypothetical protein